MMEQVLLNSRLKGSLIVVSKPQPSLSHYKGDRRFHHVVGFNDGQMELMQIIFRQHAGQMSDVMGQLRSMGEEMKKIQTDWQNDRIERENDKEELKSFILSLSGR